MATRTTNLDIRGMSCANCSATIQDTLESLDGVKSASANFATDEGAVEYDPEEYRSERSTTRSRDPATARYRRP